MTNKGSLIKAAWISEPGDFLGGVAVTCSIWKESNVVQDGVEEEDDDRDEGDQGENNIRKRAGFGGRRGWRRRCMCIVAITCSILIPYSETSRFAEEGTTGEGSGNSNAQISCHVSRRRRRQDVNEI